VFVVHSSKPRSRSGLHTARAIAVVGLGALVALVVGAATSISPKIALILACAPLGITLMDRARRPILPWLALVPIILTGVIVHPINVPLGEIGCAVALVMCMVHPPETPTRVPPSIITILVLLLVWAVLLSAIDGPPIQGALRRVFHLLLFVLVIQVIASGRIHGPDLARAIQVGLVIGFLSGIYGLLVNWSISGYVNRLTGLFEDPNVASLVTVGLGMVALHFLSDKRHRLFIILLMTAIVSFTLSRTGLLALALALLWLLVLHKLPRSIGILVVVGAVALALLLPPSIQSIGPYHAHASSDQLRAIIDQAAFSDLRHNFISGTGPGTAFITISNGERFFFHNSFYALGAEFGIVGAILYGLLIMSTIVSLLRTRPRSIELEAALLSVLVASLTIGEVLFTLVTAIIIGVTWRHVLLHPQADPSNQILNDLLGTSY